MSSRWSLLKGCVGKRGYSSKRRAVEIVDRMRRDGEINMNAYRCGRCGEWHVGHRPGTSVLLARLGLL